jgi:hypothetical protein
VNLKINYVLSRKDVERATGIEPAPSVSEIVNECPRAPERLLAGGTDGRSCPFVTIGGGYWPVDDPFDLDHVSSPLEVTGGSDGSGEGHGSLV